jgi:serine protease Do
MEEKKHSGFKRTLLIVVLAAVLGGGTLGGGLGAGYVIMNRLLPENAQTVYTSGTQAVSATEDAAPTVVPINVQAPNYASMIKDVKDSVVSINITAQMQGFFGVQSGEGAGSGFIFSVDDRNVYIATNNHVIESAQTISISLNDRDMVAAKVVGRDEASDLAVLSVSKEELDATGVPYKAAKLGDSDAVSMGDPVIAMGNAMGEGQTATQGMISASNKTIEIQGVTLNVLQTDAAINAGNSGGPLFNADGEVIGINTAKYGSSYGSTGVEGMGYSIPINDAADILGTLRDDGVIAKPFIGVAEPEIIDKRLAEMFNLPSAGILIKTIIEDSPAEKAGMQAFDIIVSFDGHDVETFEELAALVNKTKVGDTVSMTVYRGEEKLELTLVVANRNEESPLP